MDIVNLEVQKRDGSKNAKVLRKEGLVPMEFYGKGVENQSIQADYQVVRKAYNQAGFSTIVELSIEGEKKNALIHKVDTHAVTDKITHVELVNVRMDEEIHTHIPLEFTGSAPAVRDMGGILTTNLTELNVKCLPKDLVHSIEVNLDSLVDFHAFVRVADVNVPSTIEVLNEPEDVVATVVAPRVEEEPEETAAEGEEGAEGAGAESAEGGDEAAAENSEGGEEKSE